MNPTSDTNQVEAEGEGGGLDPRAAANLLDQTTSQARRALDPQPPIVVIAAAGFFLFGYGIVWWSLRDQHPAVPALWSLAVFYGLLAIAAIFGSVVSSRAAAGVTIGRRAKRQQLARSLALAAAGIGAWTFQGALRYHGVSFEIVYGVYGPTVPLIALVAAYAGSVAIQEDWIQLGACIAVIGIAAVSTFFGAQGAWGLTGLGCCLVLLVYAGVLIVRRRRA